MGMTKMGRPREYDAALADKVLTSLANMSYRDAANAYGISLGMVQRIVADSKAGLNG